VPPYGFRTSAGESTPIGTPQVLFSDVDDGTWHHILGTYSFESGTGKSTVQLFVDGSLELNWVETRAAAVGYAAQVGHIGTNDDSDAVYGRGFAREFPGAIDDVRLYNRVLSPVEIQTLVAIPEPATLFIFLLGLAALARKGTRQVEVRRTGLLRIRRAPELCSSQRVERNLRIPVNRSPAFPSRFQP
jgi:hypothetical protein